MWKLHRCTKGILIKLNLTKVDGIHITHLTWTLMSALCQLNLFFPQELTMEV